jgi:hypothetical protein
MFLDCLHYRQFHQRQPRHYFLHFLVVLLVLNCLLNRQHHQYLLRLLFQVDLQFLVVQLNLHHHQFLLILQDHQYRLEQ